jgi:uncharacterized OB-fold protein
VFRGDHTGEGGTVTEKTPPALRTHLGQDFSAANEDCALSLQHCTACGCVQYPPREVCQQCLQGELLWQDTNTSGTLLNRVAVHHSISDYFNRKIEESPWPIASVKLDCGAIVYAHLALQSFATENIGEVAPGTAVQVFSQADCSGNEVLVAVAENTTIGTGHQRQAVLERLGL